MDGFDEIFDLDSFSIDEIDIDTEFETRYIKPPKVRDIPEHLLKYKNAQMLAKNITIETGSRYFVKVDGSFIWGDFIEALITENNYHVKTLSIETLSMSENNVDSLRNLIEGDYVDELNLVVSDYFFAHERGNLIPYIYQQLDGDHCKFQLGVFRSHCKIALIETHCGLKIIIHGSANLRSSGNREQFCIEENETLYEFNKEDIDHIITHCKTINKTAKWQQAAKVTRE